MKSPTSGERRRPSPAKAARNAALVELRKFGLSGTELTRLDLEDLDAEERTLRLRGKPSECLKLPDDISQLLLAWLSYRGSKPGPLFLSLRKGETGFTAAGMNLILPRVIGGEIVLRSDARKHVKERRLVRNRALTLLYECGLEARALTALRIEDVREGGVEVGGSLIRLPDGTMAALRDWRGHLNRSSGPVFISLWGSGRVMTEAGIRLILKEAGKWRVTTRRRIPERSDASVQAIFDLWCTLPRALRTRIPEGREVGEVVQLVNDACRAGAVLEEALRIVGLSPEAYAVACEKGGRPS